MSRGNRVYALLEGIAIALEAIRANKARAALTILGVAVGVFVVVVISAGIHGINASVARDFEAAGPTTFYVARIPLQLQACDGSDESCPWMRNPPLTLEHAALLGRLSSVQAVTARVDWNVPAKHGDRALSGLPLEAYTANWTDVDGGDIYPGRSFTSMENSTAARVALINDKAATQLFGDGDPVGATIMLAGQPFEVIGLYHYTASFLAGGDRAKVIVPLNTAFRRLNVRSYELAFAVRPRSTVSRDEAIDDVTAAMRATRGLAPRADSNFGIMTQDMLFSTYNKVFGMFGIVMVALAAISLIVGGVGVIAIMMISVTERTREIGVRKALGASRGTILWQFLVEAVTLTAIGALIGLAAGWLVSLVVRGLTPIPASIPPGAILAALGASAVTGVIFGLYPASRAARLDPIDALRYE